jgi:hypothetical protein
MRYRYSTVLGHWLPESVTLHLHPLFVYVGGCFCFYLEWIICLYAGLRVCNLLSVSNLSIVDVSANGPLEFPSRCLENETQRLNAPHQTQCNPEGSPSQPNSVSDKQGQNRAKDTYLHSSMPGPHVSSESL